MLTDADAYDSVSAERSLLRALKAGCHAPVGAWTEIDGDQLSLTGVLLSLDGTTRLEAIAHGARNEAEDLGSDVARQLISAGGQEFL